MIYSIFTWNVEKKIIHISRAILWFHVYSKVGNLRYANSPNRILNLKFETNAQMQRFAFQLPVNPFPVAISSHMDLCSWCFCISVKSWSGLCRVIDWSEICLTGQTYSSPIQRWPHSWWWWWWCSKSVGKIALDTLQHHLIWQIITFKISASIRLHWSRGIKISDPAHLTNDGVRWISTKLDTTANQYFSGVNIFQWRISLGVNIFSSEYILDPAHLTNDGVRWISTKLDTTANQTPTDQNGFNTNQTKLG